MMQLFIFGISAIILLFGHGLAWYIFSNYVGGNIFLINISIIVFSFFFISIVLSSYLIHRHDNLLTRVYYFVSGIWLGVLVNFLLSFITLYLLKLTFPHSILEGEQLIIATLFLTIAISIYGVYNAYHLRVKEYEVKIKNLSPYWHNKEVVQISDVHLGPVYRKKSFTRMIDIINKLEPEAVFITGDLFDGMESDFSWLHHPFTRLNAKQGIYYSFGNHDLYLGFNYVKKLLVDSPVKILDNKLELIEGLQVIGINYSFNKDFNLDQAILDQVNYDKMKPSVLLYHEPKNIDSARKAGIDLQLSGHTHRGQMFPFNLVSRLAYKGYNYGLHQEDEFSLIVNSGLGTWGPPMRTTGRGEIVKIKLLRLE